MASSRIPPPAKLLELDLTVVSAKHLKNVNWRSGDLKPYAIFWVDPDRRLATRPDDAGSTRPVWNEQFSIPLPFPALPLPDAAALTLEVFHSKPSETPKPLVGSLLLPLRDLPDPHDRDRIRTYELLRPSGRPHGKIRIKLAVRERPAPPPPPQPEYLVPPPPTPPSGYYYGTTPPPAPSRSANLPPPPAPVAVARAVTMPPPPPATVREYRPYSVPAYAPVPPPGPAQSPPAYSYSYSDAYSGYYPGYYSSAPPPPPPRPFYDRGSGYGGPSGGPSAPVDYTTAYEKQRSGKMGLGAGLAVGAVAGALGGLALEEGLNYEEEKIADRVESDLSARDDYSEYRADY